MRTDRAVEETLRDLAARVGPMADEVSLRGEGRARFVFLTRGKRAAEASINEHGGIWVEYWSDTSDEHASAARDETFGGPETAAANIAGWLSG